MQEQEIPKNQPVEGENVTTFPKDHTALLPQNIEAEQDLLGALLNDNDILEKIPDTLEDHHFLDPLHSRIFAAIKQLHQRGQLANTITLKSYFTGDEAFAHLSIENYLGQLAENVVSLTEAPHYARDIRECYLRRKLIVIADKTISNARTAKIETSAETLIEETEQELFALAESDRRDSGLLPLQHSLNEAIQTAELAHKNSGHITGVGTGLTGLNNLLGGLQSSDLIIVAGRPGMGKTALGINIGFHAATTTRTDETPQHVAFFSLEMSSEQLANRILSSEAGIPSDQIRRGKITPQQFTELVRASHEIEQAPFYLDDTPSLSISQLASRARRLKRTHNLGLIVVDYLQLLTAPINSRTENRVNEISLISRTLKSIAKELDVPVLALAQLSRAVEQREDKRPNLADLRESGSIEQDADVVMFIYREEYYLDKKEPQQREEEGQQQYDERYNRWRQRMEEHRGRAEIIIAKQRHGPTGNVKLRFIDSQTKYTDDVSDKHLPEMTS